jgi:hypothetical protein
MALTEDLIARRQTKVDDTIYLVTGAPGSGNSATLAAFLELESDYLAFDIDWLVLTASHLAGRNVIFDKSTSLPYRFLWFDVLRCVCRNRRRPILFSPFDRRDTGDLGDLGWHPVIHWLLLDCADDDRRERLRRRDDWTQRMIDEAIEDAAYLRQTVPNRIHTGAHPVEEVARTILDWVRQHQ